MNSTAIKKAKRRFRHATDSLPNLLKLDKSASEDEYEQAWFQFLGTMNSIPEILKTGSRDDAKSRQWFASKEKHIRTDPLLRYLFHARAVDFHGDARLLKLVTSAGVPDETDYGFGRPDNRLNLHVPPDVESLRIWYESQPVKDIHGNIFHPPTNLFNKSPVGMARVALIFYKSLILEAESLFP